MNKDKAILVGLVGLLIACSDGSSGGGSTGGKGGVGGSNTESCLGEGAPCACPGRLTQQGTRVCQGTTPVCQSCEPCEEFKPAEKKPWEACGGEPFGLWRTKSSDFTGVPIIIVDEFSSKEKGRCSTRIEEQPKDFDLRLDLQSGGAMRIHFASYTLPFFIQESCAKQHGDEDKRCGALVGCSETDCGQCKCSTFGGIQATKGTWLRKDSKLTIDVGLDGQATFDYCAKENTLELQFENGPLVTLERVVASGTPVPCLERSVEQCGNECHIGVCEGAGDCQASQGEETCTNKIGCAWNKEKCGGGGFKECRLEHYGTIPGCEFTVVGAGGSGGSGG